MENQLPTDEQKAKALSEAALKGPTAPTRFSKPGGKHSAKALTPEEVRALMPYYSELGKKPLFIDFIKWCKWYRVLFRERKKLRKDLKKSYGMKLHGRDFENLAREVGLGLENQVLLWFWLFFQWIFGAGGLLTLLGASLIGIGIAYLISSIYELGGSFTIQLNKDSMSSNFVLSETYGFEVKTGRLISEKLEKVNAMTLDDLPRDIDDVQYEGSHNEKGRYVAYSFYIMNDGKVPDDYEYVIYMHDSIKGTDKAVWIMLFEDGHQVVYAAPSADGDPERLFGYIEQPPFRDVAYDRDTQYYRRDSGKWGVATTPYESEEVVCRGIVENVQPGEKHRYTVVIWLEGYDPECTDALFDGYARYYMEFNTVNEAKRDLFSSVWRREYEAPIADIEGKDETAEGGDVEEPENTGT